jgi:hypothetical protein
MLFVFCIAAGLMFIIGNRSARKYFEPKEKISDCLTNFGFLVLSIGISLLIGLKAFLLIQLPVM